LEKWITIAESVMDSYAKQKKSSEFNKLKFKMSSASNASSKRSLEILFLLT